MFFQKVSPDSVLPEQLPPVKFLFGDRNFCRENIDIMFV